jgi:tetratricopeptide (TPR) repeat protein
MRFLSAAFHRVKGLLSARAAAPKGAAVPGKFLEYKARAEQGDAEAQFSLGFCYDDGRGVAKNYAQAVKWYRQAAEQNYAPAQFNLGYCYANGQGVRKNKTEAAEWFRKAAEQNYAPAQSNLGCCYDNGRGVDKDVVARRGRTAKRLHFISPDRPAVKARMTPALLFLQEIKSMDLT